MKRRQMFFIFGFALVAILGYWLAGTAAPKKPAVLAPLAPAPSNNQAMLDDPLPKFRRAERPPSKRRDSDAANAGALEGQRVLVFKDQDALARFLARAGDKINLLGRLDALNALRVGFSEYDDLAALLDGEEEESLIYLVNDPAPPEGTVQPGAMALGNDLLDWLGITGDNSTWGKGVKIAVLDTGVMSHSAFEARSARSTWWICPRILHPEWPWHGGRFSHHRQQSADTGCRAGRGNPLDPHRR